MDTSAVASLPAGLHEVLDLNQIAKCDVFAGVGHKTPWGRVYGGQVLAQSLVAAQQTVPQRLKVHSLHGYFMLAGIVDLELLFEVDRVRDGTSFATRVVKAKQESKVIFQLTVSFHREEEGHSFQTPGREMRAIASARGLTSVPSPEELIRRGVDSLVCTGADVYGHTQSVLIAEGDWWRLSWSRHIEPVPAGSHESVLAWMSDGKMVDTVKKPHYGRGHTFGMSMSLDHAIHFHTPDLRVDEWLLFHTRTTVSAGARGLARTEIFTAAGKLVATVTQEALVRPEIARL